MYLHQSFTQVYSIGEVKKGDPFEKFLVGLKDLSPESSSTPAGQDVNANDSDNTLSEMPSIHHDETITPGLARQESNLQKKIRVIPYHKKYPLPGNVKNTAASVLGRLSPGEVPMRIRSLHIQEGDNKATVGLTALSQGMRTKSIARIKTMHQDGQQSHEIVNILRDGIDVIDISGTKQKLEHDPAMDDVLLVQPHTAPSTSRLQVIEVKSYEESEASHIETTPTVASNKVAGISDSSHSSKSESVKQSRLMEGVTLKPLTIVIPGAEEDVNPTYGESPSFASENIVISYSDDFDFSSISIPS